MGRHDPTVDHEYSDRAVLQHWRDHPDPPYEVVYCGLAHGRLFLFYRSAVRGYTSSSTPPYGSFPMTLRSNTHYYTGKEARNQVLS